MRRRLQRSFRRSLQARLAGPWRRRLKKTTFVAVTGSCGKTTAVALLDALLSTKGRVHAGIHRNTRGAVNATIMRTRPWHCWCLQEVSGHAPGEMAARVETLRPQIGIVTVVGTDHIRNFRSLDAIAAEKGELIARLPADGLAILNADDARVLAMRQRSKARVVTYGLTAEADLRAVSVAAAWPQRLSLEVAWRGGSAVIDTQLVGEFWVTSVLAALACALEQGISLEEAVPIIEAFRPLLTRNSVHAIEGGPTFLLDTIKAPFGTIGTAVDILATATAPRKTLVLGNISDYVGSGSGKYRKVAREALAAGARVIGIGPNAAAIGKLAPNYPAGEVMTFATSRQTRDYLRAESIPGELIVVKSAESLHIERVVLNWSDDGDRCWVENCGLKFCRSCRHLANPRRRPGRQTMRLRERVWRRRFQPAEPLQP